MKEKLEAILAKCNPDKDALLMELLKAMLDELSPKDVPQPTE